MTLATPDAERRAALRAMKLRALVRDTFGVQDAEPTPFGPGAALRHGRRGWVLAEDSPQRALGPALAWGRTHDVVELHLLVEDEADELARRAEPFDPAPTVWAIEGRDLVEAVAVAHREDVHAAPAVPPDVLALLEGAGVDVLREHGELTGEVLGLEIARLVVDPDVGPRLEVGVGRHDREAFALLHGDLPPEAAIAQVVGAVRTQRQVGAAPHPLNRLAGERWLRARLVAEPALVGAAELRPVAPIWPRESVKDVVPAAAVGMGHDDVPVVVVASTGIDLDLVPEAADVRSREWLDDGDGRLVLVVPERDAHPVTQALADALRFPAELVAIPGDWRGTGPADRGRP